MINVPISAAFELTQCAPALAESERVEALLAGRGRLVLRPSGTEPVIRVMIEGKDAAENLQLAEGIAEVIRQAI
jgi:phosphoglucosamine mutase